MPSLVPAWSGRPPFLIATGVVPMLSQIRSALSSWAVLLLLGVLIASFALWGIPDLFRATGARAVAEVDDVEISDVEFSRAYDSQIRRLEAQIGQAIDRNQALALGLPQQVLQQMIGQLAFDLHARRLGLRAGVKQVLDELRKFEAFQGFDGKFDRREYESQLRRLGLTPAEFEKQLMSDLVRQQLVDALLAAPPAPDPLLEPLFRYRHEARSATIVSIATEDVGPVPEPTETELRATYEVDKSRYMTPPYREVALAVISPDRVARPDEVTREELEEAYQARLAEFQVPELRDLDMVIFDINDKEKAERFVERVRSGEDFAAVVKEMTDFKPDEVALGDQSRSDLEQDYNQRVAEAAFSTPEGAVSEPVQSVFGWHVFRVKAVTQPRERTLDQVAPTLRQDVAREKAYDAIYDLSVKAEEALTRGAGVEEIAETMGLELVRTTVTREGRLENGGPAPQVVRDHLQKIWSMAVDEPPTLEETTDNGFVILDVTNEIPPRQRPFEEVADAVRANILSERRLKAAGKRADEIAERIRNGDDPNAVAREYGLTVLQARGVVREEIGRTSKVAPIVARLLFELDKPGAVGVERAATGSGYVVVRLESVRPGDREKNPSAYAKLKEEVAQAMVNDALVQYQRALLASLGVEINNVRFQQIVNPQGNF